MPGPNDNRHDFIFLIDTDSYAGGLERQLTAFCTGCVGECGVGEEYAEVFRQECPELLRTFEDLVALRPDDSGCRRPTSIWTTPGFWNDGMGNHWPDSAWDTPEAIDAYKQAVQRNQTQNKKFVGRDRPNRHPSYQSVAIFFDKLPPDEVLHFLVQRVKAYKPIGEFDDKPNVIGFRLIQTEVVEKILWQTP